MRTIILVPSFVCSFFVGDAFNAEERTVVAGYDNGDIKMFDLKKMAVRWETNIKNGVLFLILFDICCLVIIYQTCSVSYKKITWLEVCFRAKFFSH